MLDRSEFTTASHEDSRERDAESKHKSRSNNVEK